MSDPEREALDVCRGLIACADRMRHEHPARALELARSARDVAAGLDAATLAEDWTAVQTEAWSVLASAYRNTGRLDDAEAALVVASSFLDTHGSPTPRTAPRWMQRAAYLRADQNRHDEALELIEAAIEGYRRMGADDARATARVDLGVLLGRAGRPREAVAVLATVLDEGDVDDPRTYLAAIHNLAVHLQEIADSPSAEREATRWLELAIRCHRRFPETVGLLKLRGLCALAALRRGDVEHARGELWAAHDGFARLGDRRQQALFLLDLVALALGNDRELTRVNGALFSLLRTLAGDRETSATLLAVTRALTDGTLTRAAVRDASRALARPGSDRGPAR